MAKKPLPPVILPVVRVERTNAGSDEVTGTWFSEGRDNVVDLNAYRYRRDRAREERLEPPSDT